MKKQKYNVFVEDKWWTDVRREELRELLDLTSDQLECSGVAVGIWRAARYFNGLIPLFIYDRLPGSYQFIHARLAILYQDESLKEAIPPNDYEFYKEGFVYICGYKESYGDN